MARLNRKEDFQDGNIAFADQVDAELNQILDLLNGNLASDNIAPGTLTKDRLAFVISEYWQDPVATFADLAALSPNNGDIRMSLDTFDVYVYNEAQLQWKKFLAPSDHNNLLNRTALDAHPITSITGLELRLTDIESDITINANDISALATRMTAAEADITALENTDVSHGTRLTDLENRVTTAENGIATRDTDITNLQNKDLDHDNQILDHEGRIVSLENTGLPASVTTQINDNTNRLNTVEPIVTDHGTRITTNEGSISDLYTITGNLEMNVNDVATNTVTETRYESEVGLNVLDYGVTQSAGDSLPIQNILNANPGKTIYFPEGTYGIDTPILLPTGTRIKAHEKAIFQKTASMNNMFRSKMALDGTGATDIVWIGGVIDGNSSVYAEQCTMLAFGNSQDIRLENIHFKNCYDWHMLEINSSKEVKVLNCSFESYGDYTNATRGTEMLQIDLMKSSAQYPWDTPVFDNKVCSSILIEGCKFLNGVDGIGTHSSTVGYTPYDIIIKNCHFEKLAGVAVKGLNWYHTDIKDNLFVTCYKGITMNTDGTTTNENIRIENNVFRSISYRDSVNARAIELKYCNRSTVKNNYVRDTGRHAIGADYCENIIIESNTVRDSGMVGIWLYGSKYSIVANNTVKDSSKSAAGYGDIQLGGTATAGDTTKNIISNNTVLTMIIKSSNVNSLVGNNISNTSGLTVEASATFFKRVANWIGGTWEATAG